MRGFYVHLEQNVFDELVELALRERRRPQDQAAVLLTQALTALVQDGPHRETAPPPADVSR